MVAARRTNDSLAVLFCVRCSARQIDTDKFCRHCGISRSLADTVTSGLVGRETERELARRGVKFDTQPLSGSTHDFTTYTNPIIKVVTEELDQLPGSVRNSPWAMRMISTLIAIPIWIVFVLLSPINAYVAVRSIARQS